jgi:hypothetical protein
MILLVELVMLTAFAAFAWTAYQADRDRENTVKQVAAGMSLAATLIAMGALLVLPFG